MKKTLFFLAAILSVAVISCKKGPAGPAGPAGKDASTKCVECHNSSSQIYAAQLQYENSVHATGITSGYSNRKGCAECHTNEGFNEVHLTGLDTIAGASIENPTPVSCYTCHNVHKNYDSTDMTLKLTGPVKFKSNGITADLGISNQCVYCHQSRPLTGMTLTQTSTDSIRLTSSRFGPHHGPQSNLFAGQGKSGAYEIAGATPYENSNHTTMITNACIVCHMGKPYGHIGGGHSMKVVYDNEGTETLNTTACSSCHTNATSLNNNVKSTQAEIAGLLGQLRTILSTKNYLDTNTGLFKASSSKPLKLSAVQAKVLYNYAFINEDRSAGVHNYNYAKALLQNSLDVAKTW